MLERLRGLHSYSKRWCVVEEGMLRYYKSDTAMAQGKEVKGEVDLRAATEIRSGARAAPTPELRPARGYSWAPSSPGEDASSAVSAASRSLASVRCSSSC